jgi:hypothetical protein
VISEMLSAQLRAELGAVARAVGDVLGRDVLQVVFDRLGRVCDELANELYSGDERLVSDAVQAVLAARWPEDTEPPAWWWRTPVGMIAAHSLSRADELSEGE